MLFWQLTATAQTQAEIKLDTNSLLIGDQTKLTLSFTLPVKYSVYWPQFADTLMSKIEIVSRSAIDSAFSNNNSDITYIQKLTITSFDSGYYAIPPLRFYYSTPGDTTRQFAESEAELLEVHNVPVDTQKGFKDIKAPMEAPFTLREALPWIIGFLILGGIIILLIYYLKKRKNQQPIFKAPPKPALPAYLIALDALENLRHKKVWQSGNIKKYHTELTDIIREYLSAKFNFQAMEFTTDEIMQSIEHSAANPDAREKLRQTLQLADMVKFAKMQPLPLEHDASLNNAIDFVNETKHIGTPVPFVEKTQSPEPKTPPAIEISDGKEVIDVQ